MPPTQDALYLHFDRANYQCYEWKRALEKGYLIESPIGHGWKLDEGNICIDWMSEKPAPDAILEFVSCNCKKNKCQTGSCSCKSFELVRTEACGCSYCENCTSDDDTDIEEDSDNDSDSSDDDIESDDLSDNE